MPFFAVSESPIRLVDPSLKPTHPIMLPGMPGWGGGGPVDPGYFPPGIGEGLPGGPPWSPPGGGGGWTKPGPPKPPIPIEPNPPVVIDPSPGGPIDAVVIELPPSVQPPPPPSGVPAESKAGILWYGPGTLPVMIWIPPIATTKPIEPVPGT